MSLPPLSISAITELTQEFVTLDDITGGDIYLGLAESYQIRMLARAIKAFQRQYPELHYHITSGDTEQVTEKLDKGLLDFVVLVETPDAAKYEALSFPQADVWGLIFPADDPFLSIGKEQFYTVISAEDVAATNSQAPFDHILSLKQFSTINP